MMFIFQMPIDEEPTPRRRKGGHIITEQEYYKQGVKELALLKCPKCGEHNLFQGCVFVGCLSCLNYFSEDEIIESNGGVI